MTRTPVCCEPGDAVTRAAELMRQHDVGSLPVVESRSSGKLIGIVTDRDVVTRILAGHRDVNTATVRDAMTKHLASCHEDEDLEHAVSLMAERQVRRMPVVDQQGRITGIISQADVAVRGQRDQTTGELVEAISEPPATR
jgi:CBS domain-containing protein